MTKIRALVAMYMLAGLTMTFAHWNYVALEHEMPPIASIVVGILWPIACYVLGVGALT